MASAHVLNLKEDRMVLVTQARAILDKAEKEKRPLDAVEKDSYEKIDAKIESVTDTITKAEKLEGLEASAAKREERKANPEDFKQEAAPIGRWLNMATTARDAVTNKVKRTFGAVAPTGVRATAEYKRAWSNFLETGHLGGSSLEVKAALQADSDTAGGFLVPPQEFIANLIQNVDDLVFVRQLATVTPVTSADSVGRPSLDTQPADADWTSELLIGNEDTALAFGKRELHPHPLAKLIKVSRKLLRVAALPADAIVTQRLAYKFGISQEKAFLAGTGVNQPLGLFTASADGIDTSRDVSTGNSTTAIAADGLIEALYSLKAQYMAKASWLFSRTAVKNIRKLKDGEGQYLWKPGLGSPSIADPAPDRILDRPFYMSEYVPSTFTTGLYVGLIGDLSHYWIADALNFELQRLNELYAATNQVGFVGRWETDAMPDLAEAFARVKLA